MRLSTILFLFLCNFLGLLSHENTNFIRFKNFQREERSPSKSEQEKENSSEDIAGYNELKIWANYQMLDVLPDDPGYGLKDGICRFVPSSGVSFLLTANPEIKKKIHLFIDFAVFKPLSEYSAEMNHSLKILINGKIKKIYYFSIFSAKSPLMVDIDPSELDYDKLAIQLIPDTTPGKFWCIWDSYYSYEMY